MTRLVVPYLYSEWRAEKQDLLAALQPLVAFLALGLEPATAQVEHPGKLYGESVANLAAYNFDLTRGAKIFSNPGLYTTVPDLMARIVKNQASKGIGALSVSGACGVPALKAAVKAAQITPRLLLFADIHLHGVPPGRKLAHLLEDCDDAGISAIMCHGRELEHLRKCRLALLEDFTTLVSDGRAPWGHRLNKPGTTLVRARKLQANYLMVDVLSAANPVQETQAILKALTA